MDAWQSGARSILFVSPTGSGKTTAFTYLIAQLAAAGFSAIILVHRRELAEQAANRLREFGVRFGYIMAGQPSDPCARVQIATVQTLVRRKCPPAALVVADEAHLSTAKTWQTIIEQYPQARILGCTATPWRMSGKPLVGAYDACVVVATPAELREAGHLCPYVGFSYLTPDLSGVATVGGEYNEKQSAEAMSQSVIVDTVVEEWVKHARELSTVVFAVTVEHSKQLTARFKAAGVVAEHLDGATPLEQRRAILKRVDAGITRVLCNVAVAVEGLDIPRLKCCILARPTKSLARAIQMMGRVRRPWNGVTARIHDHAFVIRGQNGLSGHGLPDDERDYTLNAKPEKPPNLKMCKECRAYYQGRACDVCGHEAPAPPREEREIQTVTDAEQFTFESGQETTPAARPEKPVEVRWDRIGKGVEGVYSKTWEESVDWGKQRYFLLRGKKRDYRVPGTTRLNALMSGVPLSDYVWITHTAETELAGGKRRKEFKVERDDSAP